MTTVTVAGADGKTIHLDYTSSASVAIAKQLAAAITAGVDDGAIIPFQSTGGPPPSLPPGKTGEFIQSTDGVTILPHGYDALVVTAQDAVVFGSGDANEKVLSSTGNLTFFATGGSGSIAAGGGNNSFIIPVSDNGNWLIAGGNGNDFFQALGGGNDTIEAGSGGNSIILGGGSDLVQSSGDDSILAGSGPATIAAIGNANDLIYGGSGTLLFVGGAGSATILGGRGSETVFGGAGTMFVSGGSNGHNMLFAGTGAATLIGGGDDDELFANGSQAQSLRAAGGNETLFAGFASGSVTLQAGSGHDQLIAGLGNETLIAGTGSATMTGGFGNDRFAFIKGEAGGTDLLLNFTGQDKVDLIGYGSNAVSDALKTQKVSDGSVTITLADNTKITFAGITSLTRSDFVTNGDGSLGHHHWDDPNHWHGHGH